MNFHKRSTFCFVAFVLAYNFATIAGRPAEDEVSPSTTDKGVKTTNEEYTDTTSSKPKSSSSSVVTSSSTSDYSTSEITELALGDQPGKEPNAESRPEMEEAAKTTKETTTVPPFLHTSNESSSGSSTTTTTTTTTTPAVPAVINTSAGVNDNGNVHQTSTETTPGTTTKGQNAATGLHEVQFFCFVASAMLLLVR